MSNDIEVHDHSRTDAYLRTRQRVAFLSAVWRPMLAGAAGAALRRRESARYHAGRDG